MPRIQQLLPEPPERVLGASSTGVSNRFPPVEPGDLLGHIVAINPLTGETLWEFQTGSSLNATAITYTLNGRQQVTVASGLGGGLANRYARGLVPAGGSIWTFALMPK